MRDTAAIQLNLDEIIRAIDAADDYAMNLVARRARPDQGTISQVCARSTGRIEKSVARILVVLILSRGGEVVGYVKPECDK